MSGEPENDTLPSELERAQEKLLERRRKLGIREHSAAPERDPALPENLSAAALRFLGDLPPDQRSRAVENLTKSDPVEEGAASVGDVAAAIVKKAASRARSRTAAREGPAEQNPRDDSWGPLRCSLLASSSFQKLPPRDVRVLLALISSRDRKRHESSPGLQRIEVLTGYTGPSGRRRIDRAIASLLRRGVIRRVRPGGRAGSAVFIVAESEDEIQQNRNDSTTHRDVVQRPELG